MAATSANFLLMNLPTEAMFADIAAQPASAHFPDPRFWIVNRKMSHQRRLCVDSVAHTGDSAAEPDAMPGRDARIAYSDQAATDAITSGVVRESAAYQDATANGNV